MLFYLQVKFEATLATETLLTSEEAVIAAASAEAVTLAKAALKVAKDAALMVKNSDSAKADSVLPISPEADALHFKWIQLMKTDRAGTVDLVEAEAGVLEHHSEQYVAEESDDVEPTREELEALQEQLSKSKAVRSRRQTERKARRARAADKAAANVVSVKPGSTSRKKRASLQDVDYYDPLRYLRATTSSSKLLTATEELELSEGIQV